MYRNILVPLDGSTLGEHALPLALGLARRAGASLRLLHVCAPPAFVYPEGAFVFDAALEQDLKDHQRGYLNDLARQLGIVAPVPVQVDLLDGPVAATVRATASATGADLVVMTTHGRGMMARFWLGSVADELVRDSSVPLLLVRPGEGRPHLDQEPPLKRILLPLDGTPLAEQMLEPAAALGALTGAAFTLLRVVSPVMPLHYDVEGTPFGQRIQAMVAQIEKLQAEVSKEALGYLDGVAEKLRGRGLQVETRVIVDHYPAKAILAEGAASAANLIALETHGRRGVKRLFLGSVADKIIRGAAVPVLVHRPTA